MHILWHDFELRSRVDIRSCGAPIYAADKSTEALCMSYAIDDEDPSLWIAGQPVPDAFRQAVSEGWELHAWNAAFERYITRLIMAVRHGWPLPRLEQYRCTMAKSRYNNLPGKLEDCGERLKIPKQYRKDSDGHKIMLKLCKPNNKGQFVHDPVALGKMYAYCKQDIVAERYIDSLLKPMPESEQQVWFLDRIVNERGCPCDVPFCRSAYNMVESLAEDANVEIRKLTATEKHPNGYVTSTGCVAKIKELVQARGVNIGSLGKDEIGPIIKTIKDPVAKRLLELRQLGAPASVKKYKSAIEKASADGMIRESLLYYGASATGRYAAGSADSASVQLQNLFRKVADPTTMEVIGSGDLDLLRMMYINPMAALQTGVRGLICAPKDHVLVLSDSAAIEARIVLWLAGARAGVKLFEKSDAGTGPEPYCVMGAKVYSLPVEKVVKGTDARAVGKVAVLGLGFGMGATKFQMTAKSQAGMDLDMPMCEKTVKVWRALNPEVCKLWRDCEEAFKKCANGAKEIRVNKFLSFHNVGGGTVSMRLPCGRELFYHEAKATRRGIRFMTNKGIEETWGGHLVENAVQAIARDIIVYVMGQLEKLYGAVVLTIHDEIVQSVRKTRSEEVAAETHRLMKIVPAWAPGLPLNAETKIAKRLTK
jgi:DNA polymerase